MNDTLPTRILLPVVAAAVVLGVLWTWFHPAQFSNVELLGTLLFLELLLFFVWHFQRLFFAAVMFSFLWAGTAVPWQDAFNIGRWVVLGFGAVVGFIMWMKSSYRSFGPLHLVAAFCVLSAGVSAMVSDYPTVALAKTASLFLLFLYGAAGARVAVLGREKKFFQGLVFAMEIVVYLAAVCYFALGLKVFGNPNSLGSSMGIGAFPVLLWAWLNSQKTERARMFFALLLCCGLLLFSLARAAILAAACVTVVLCISLRAYKLLLKGAAILLLGLSVTAILAPSFFEGVATEFSDAVLYKGHKEQGIFGSRSSPWDVAMTEIKRNPFFGSGFGTSATGEDPGFVLGKFHSTSEVSREHGSSYLAIAEWVGLLGLVPFVALLLIVVLNIWKVCTWMRGSGDPSHFAIPLAMVLLAGLVHAGFEDWLFAVGYYVSVYFWAFAFVLPDLIPATVLRSPVRSGAAPHRAYRLEPIDSTQ